MRTFFMPDNFIDLTQTQSNQFCRYSRITRVAIATVGFNVCSRTDNRDTFFCFDQKKVSKEKETRMLRVSCAPQV